MSKRTRSEQEAASDYDFPFTIEELEKNTGSPGSPSSPKKKSKGKGLNMTPEQLEIAFGQSGPTTRAQMNNQFQKDEELEMTENEETKLKLTAGGGLLKLKKRRSHSSRTSSRRRKGGKLKRKSRKNKSKSRKKTRKNQSKKY